MRQIQRGSDAKVFCDRLDAEDRKVLLETGRGPGPRGFTSDSIDAALAAGDKLYLSDLGDAGTEPHRVLVWLHRELEGWYVREVRAPSTRLAETFRAICDVAIAEGLGQYANWDTFSSPIVDAAVASVQPERGDYRRGVWVRSATGSTYRQLWVTARALLGN